MTELMMVQEDYENLGYPTILENDELVVFCNGLVAVWINESSETYSDDFITLTDMQKGQITHLIMRYRQGRMLQDLERRLRGW